MKRATILVVEDNPITRKMIRVTLMSESYSVLEAPDGTTALELLAQHAPDLVLQDLLLPDMDGFELLARSRELPQGTTVPILAISGFLSKMEQARSLQAGFTDYLFKPIEASRLLATVQAYLRAHDPSSRRGCGQHVLVVDDDPLQLKLVRVNLEQLGFRVTTAQDGVEALEKARAAPPAAIVSDVLMPRMDGFQLCMAVRQDQALAGIPLLLTSAVYNEEADQQLAQSVGANAFLMRTPDSRELADNLLKCLHQMASPPLHQQVVLPSEQYTHRVIRQLEHQVGHSANLARRVALLEAELGIVARIVETLKNTATAETVLSEVLFRCLDAAGISSGAAYLLDPEGNLRLRARLGYQGTVGRPLAESEQHAHLLHRVLKQGEPLEVSVGSAENGEGDALAIWGAKSILIAPLVVGSQRLGVLEMVSATRELGEDWIAFAKTVGSQIGQSLELAHTLSRLSASEQRYRDLVQEIDAIVWEADAATRRFTFVSERAVAILGYPLERWLEGTDFLADILLPRDRERALAASRAAVAEGRDHVLEYRVFDVNEQVVWLHDTVRILLDEQGKARQLRGVMVVITERVQLEEQETKLRLAQQIHQRLFPAAAPQGVGYDIGGVSYPAEATGGDCFDYLPMGDGSLAIAIGDVSGHGFGPALLMAETRAYIRALALTRTDVSEVLALLNQALCRDMAVEHFVTMLLARLDTRDGSLTYAGAGHPAGYVLDSSGNVKATLVSEGFPLGIEADAEFPAGNRIYPAPGDIMLFLTDGITEAHSPDGEQFGPQRALDFIRLYRRQAARDIAENLYRAIRAFTQNFPQDDDITAVVIKVQESE